MSEFKEGDRVRIVKVPRGEERYAKDLLNREGVVTAAVGAALFIRVTLDEMPSWWGHEEGLPMISEELEKL